VPQASLDDYRWLTGVEAADVLTRAAAMTGELATRVGRLRREISPERAALVLEQVELRRHGREKFRAAEQMFFTAVGLQQATDEFVAAYKASRLVGQNVADLCCGIGGDLLALAARGQATGVDRDPVVAVIAQANARTLSADQGRAEVRACDVAEVDLREFDAWHIDPDRRPGGHRTTHADWHEPSAAVIDGLLARNPRAAVKLAPAAEWPEAWTARAELEWISRARSCRQLVVWFGTPATQPGMRRATLLGSDVRPLASFVGQADRPVEIAEAVGEYLFEPDAAVLAARLDGALAERHALAAVAEGTAYWTGPQPIDDPLLSCFRVREVLPFDVKQLKSLLRARSIGRLEIKVRGVDEDPARLRPKLQLTGTEQATLLIARIERRVTAILAERVD
jgi:SAM-dependent methyltransferase